MFLTNYCTVYLQIVLKSTSSNQRQFGFNIFYSEKNINNYSICIQYKWNKSKRKQWFIKFLSYLQDNRQMCHLLFFACWVIYFKYFFLSKFAKFYCFHQFFSWYLIWMSNNLDLRWSPKFCGASSGSKLFAKIINAVPVFEIHC